MEASHLTPLATTAKITPATKENVFSRPWAIIPSFIQGSISLCNRIRTSSNSGKLSPRTISKSFEQDNKAGELDETEEVLGMILPTDEDATLPLYPGEEALEPASAASIGSGAVYLAWAACCGLKGSIAAACATARPC
jgi:hypothetical protein